MDLVSNEGGDPRGDFIQTVDVTDVHTGWTETGAVKNKAQVWVLEALKDIKIVCLSTIGNSIIIKQGILVRVRVSGS